MRNNYVTIQKTNQSAKFIGQHIIKTRYKILKGTVGILMKFELIEVLVEI